MKRIDNTWQVEQTVTLDLPEMIRRKYEELLGRHPMQSHPPIKRPELIEGAIQKAKELLHIRGPVVIEFHDHDCVIPSMGPTLGNYNARGAMSDAHHIRLSLTMNRSHERLEQCLWHELTHAAQRDRFDSAQSYQAAYNRDHNYITNPFEVEARRNEEHNWDLKLLEVPE